MQFNSHAQLNGTRLQLTDATTSNEAGSAFWTTPVNVQNFTNVFTFQLTNPNADGFTFTIQNVGATAIGGSGGSLGYAGAGMGSSVAVKFDLYSNAGEGNNSTGLYTNGATPTVPATTLAGAACTAAAPCPSPTTEPAGVPNLHSGDVMQVQMTYNGTTLTMTIMDTTTPANTFTISWPINIPATVGGNTAYVGFTGGTGGQTAIQDIVAWTYEVGSG
jgi:hypothetical protein